MRALTRWAARASADDCKVALGQASIALMLIENRGQHDLETRCNRKTAMEWARCTNGMFSVVKALVAALPRVELNEEQEQQPGEVEENEQQEDEEVVEVVQVQVRVCG